MDELEVIQKLGVATSQVLVNILKKPRQNVIGCLNTLEKLKEIRIVELSYHKCERRLYMTNEIYRDYFKEEGQSNESFNFIKVHGNRFIILN